jgi:transposase
MKHTPSKNEARLQDALDAQVKLNQSLQLSLERLQQQLDNLLRILYGKKSEKTKKEEAVADTETALPKTTPKNVHKLTSDKQQPKRQLLPEHFPREKIIYELPESERTCQHCGTLCQAMVGQEEITEKLEYIPARLYVKQYVRYKYVCKNGCCVKTPPLPAQPIEKGIPGPGLLADILTSKYQDAMPLYRQTLRFKRYNMELSDSTLCDWVMQSAILLEPIVIAMKNDLLNHLKLHTDDTTVPVLAKGKTKTGRIWVYVADGSCGYKSTIYDYTPSRSQEWPKEFLGNFKGFLQADAYSGYDVIYKDGHVIEIGCMAHVRRKFFEVSKATASDTIADDALEKIAKIYEIEKKIRGYERQKRFFYRKKYSKSLYHELHRWLIKNQKLTLNKTPIQQAINYALNHWRALTNVFRDGRLEVDNNTAERAIKPVVIGRKNYLFAGSDEGARKAAIIYSLIETCKQNNLNAFEYLRDVLTRLPSHKANKINELLPYHWQASA